MECVYEQTLAHFGGGRQLQKLFEEAEELVEALAEYFEAVKTQNPERFNLFIAVNLEIADVLNVIRSLQTRNPAIEVAARSKMFRTQIRMKTGYYEEER